MKVYTKTGDKGKTSLIGGKRVFKNSPRLEAYGSVDELNSHLGMIRSYPIGKEEDEYLIEIQKRLFDLGGNLATDPEAKNLKVMLNVSVNDIELMEKEIDRMDAFLPPMDSFIIPGGSPSVSASHIARTVCRRVERRILDLAELDEVSPIVIKYINRLSDYLFVLSRKLAFDVKLEEVKWLP